MFISFDNNSVTSNPDKNVFLLNFIWVSSLKVSVQKNVFSQTSIVGDHQGLWFTYTVDVWPLT